MRSKPLLTRLATQGKPLVEVHLTVSSKREKQSVMDAINGCSDDIGCYHGPYEEAAIYVQGTAESLGWLFGCRFYRVLVNPALNQANYKWMFQGEIRLPVPIFKYIASIDGLSQPGYDDEGQQDTVTYEEPPRRPI